MSILVPSNGWFSGWNSKFWITVAGLDMKTFWDAIRSSSGNSFVWETGGPMVMQGNYDPSFDIALHCKDNQLCYDIAKKHKVCIYILLWLHKYFYENTNSLRIDIYLVLGAPWSLWTSPTNLSSYHVQVSPHQRDFH